MSNTNQSRRNFVKRSAYTAPVILTLMASPEFAKAGSVKPPRDRHDNGPHKTPRHGPWSD
jgi:hypothetical protein